jgi:hypothetical protein
MLFVGSLWGQTDRAGHGWVQYFGDHPFGGTRWGLHLEGQWRRDDLVSKWQNLLLRSAINYKINSRFDVAAGYGFVETYRYGAFPAASKGQENRLYQDLNWRVKIGRVKLQNRFRAENRWLPGSRYENRFRYLARATMPLKGKTGLVLANEIFMPTPPEAFPRRFDQNRVMVLLSRQLLPHLRLEAGYMLQTVWQRNGRIREDNHTIVLAFWSDQPFRR